MTRLTESSLVMMLISAFIVAAFVLFALIGGVGVGFPL